MPLFKYTAIDAAGQRRKGHCEAADIEEAREVLRGRSLFPESIRAVKTSTGARVGKSEIAGLTRELALLLEGGLNLDTALDAMVGRKRSRNMSHILHDIRRQVKEGFSFSRALSEYPGIFKKFFISMVKVGEESGELAAIMGRLADYEDRSLLMSRRLFSALTYPAFLSLLSIAVLIFLLSYVVPTLTELFVEMQVVMPLATRALIAVCTALRRYWYILAGALLALVMLVRFGLRHERLKGPFHRTFLKIPFFGHLLIKMEAARFMGALGLLHSTGMPLVSSLEVAEGLVGNVEIAGRVGAVKTRVIAGEALSESLEQENVFPEFPTQVVMAGEQSGNLGEALQKLAVVVDRESQLVLETAVSMFEPIIITVFGLVIGFIVISMLLPILGLSQISF